MSEAQVFLTRDGTPWTPRYLDSIDLEICIGCARCYKVCAQDVLEMRGVDEDGEFTDVEDDEDDDANRMVMTIKNKGACIGCSACARVCSKKVMHFVEAA